MTKSNIIFSLNFVLTIPEARTHPFSLNYDTTKFDKSIHFGPNSRDPSSMQNTQKMRIYRKYEINKMYKGNLGKTKGNK